MKNPDNPFNDIPEIENNPRILAGLSQAASMVREFVGTNGDTKIEDNCLYEDEFGNSVTIRSEQTEVLFGNQPIIKLPTSLVKSALFEHPKEISLWAHDYSNSSHYPIKCSTLGWSKPYTPQEIRVHKGWTIGASAVGSTILSVSASMFGPQVTDHLPHFDYHAEGVNIERILDGKTTKQIGPFWEKVSEKDSPASPTNIPAIALSTGNVQKLPMAPDFVLDRPELRSLDVATLNQYVQMVKDKIDKGYTLDKLEFTGLASDETELDASMGLGKTDPQNEALASARAELIKNAVLEILEEKNLHVDSNQVLEQSHESVLSPEDASFVNKLLPLYRANPDLLSPSEMTKLQQLLDNNRGGYVRFYLHKDGESIPHGKKTTVSECVVETRTDISYHENKIPFKDDFRFVILPFPIPILRRDKWPEPIMVRVVDPPDSDPEPEPRGPDDDFVPPKGPSSNSKGVKQRLPNAHSNREKNALSVMDTYYRRIRRGKRAAKIIIGALLVTGAVSVRGDVGYCPDTTKHAEQSFTFKKFPNRFDLQILNPFTSKIVATDLIFDFTCHSDSPGNEPDPAPCSSRETQYQNGELKSSITHHKYGATKTEVTNY